MRTDTDRARRARQAARLAGGISAAALALALSATQASAQFVCSGYTDGLGPAVPPPILLLRADSTAAAAEIPTAPTTDTRVVNDGGSLAWDYGSMACGKNAQAIAANSTAVGNGARVDRAGGQSVAIGTGAYAGSMAYAPDFTDSYSTSVGAYASAGVRATAVGAGAYGYVDSSSFGYNASSYGSRSVAVGSTASSGGDDSVSVGYGANDGGLAGQVAVGSGARVASVQADGVTPVAGTNVALGQDSLAQRGSQQYYAAYGYGRPAYSVGEVAVGTSSGGLRQITGVAPGSAGSDAVNVDQLKGAIDNASFGTGTGGPIVGNDISLRGAPIAPGADATAAGYGATALGANSVALGSGSVANRDNSVSFGSAGNERVLANVAAGTQATDAVNLSQLNLVGAQVSSMSGRVSALEALPAAGGGGVARTYPVAAENAAGTPAPTAAGTGATALGYGAQADAANSVAVGAGSVTTQANTVSFGSAGNARRLVNVAAGLDDTDGVNVAQMRAAIETIPQAPYVPVAANNASNLPRPTAAGADALGIGYGANAAGNASVAVGRATSGGNRSAALGDGASSGGASSLALGATSSASGDLSTAVGAGAVASGVRSLAMGAGASATGAGSTAVGAGARATRDGQVAVGTSSSTYTMAGLPSQASRAQQSGPAYFATTDSQGNLAATTFDTGRIDTMDNRISNLDGRVGGLEGRMAGAERNIGILRNDVRRNSEGVSIAMAMAGVQLDPTKNYSVSANWGTFEGENGVAATAAARVSDFAIVHGGVGFGTNRGSVGGRAGITFGW